MKIRHLLILAGITTATMLLAQNTASTAYSLPKKLIEYGWDVPKTTYVSQNIRKMEELPFDGVIFKLAGGGQVFGLDPLTEENFTKDYENCKNIKWGKFTDNFIILWAASKQDWFNDAHWKNIENNTRLMTRAAKLANCVGICFDHEPYGTNPWSYKTAIHNKEKSFAEYEAMARKRGAQFIKAAESEFPGLTVLTFFQLSYFSNLLIPMDPAKRAETLSSHYYALLPAFLNGMLDASTPAMQIVDGNESAYYYTDSNSYFEEYQRVTQRAKLLIAPENQYKYRNQMQVGQSLYIDQYFSLRSSKVLSNYLTPEEQQKWFEHNVYWSLYTTDKYVWCYSEKMNWWLNTTVPKGCAEAIISAKNKLAAGKPLGYNMKDIVKRGEAKLKEEMQKKLKIKKADINKIKQGTKPPVIDGKLDEALWTNAALAPMEPLASSKNIFLNGQTIAYLTYDDNALYFAFKCQEQFMDKLITTATGHDNDGIWLGDDVEFFLCTTPGKNLPFAHFIMDPNGVTWEAMHTPETDLSFNPQWSCKATKAKDAWYVEAAVPWTSLGLKAAPAPGTVFKGNFCRQRKPKFEMGAWSAQATGFLEHELFGSFTFK